MAKNYTSGTQTQVQAQSTTDPEEYLNKMYDSSLASQKETLTQNYDQNVSNLDYEKEQAQKQTDANLTKTYVEAAKAAKNYGEVQNAYGLTSGAMAQAKLAQDTTLQQDLTALRGAQTQVDANIERQRGLLAKEYASAIAKAQADNDMARAEALYQAAKEEELRLFEMKENAAQLIAQYTENPTLLLQLYGMSDSDIKKYLKSGSSSSGSSSGSNLTAKDLAKKAAESAGTTGTTETSSSDSGKYTGAYGSGIRDYYDVAD